MPGRVLAGHFARQMLPLAALAGLVVALAPPVAYRATAWPKLRSQAQVYADHLAAAMRGLVARQPTLWRFDADKVWQATAAHRGQADVQSVRVTDCEGRTLFAPERAAGQPSPDGPAGWAPILSGDEPVAWVEVRVDSRAERRALGLVGLVSGLLGLATGLALFLFPTRVVRRQAGALEQTFGQLKAAEAALTEANRALEGRVAEAVAEARRLSERVVDIQEEERRRIARDLHDSVGQDLTAIQLELALARAGKGEEAASHLAEAGRCSEEALREVRRVVHDLRPPELGTAGLAEILRSYVERFEVRSGMAASFRQEGTSEPSPEVATCLLRVLQEALTNAARHSQATEVGVRLELSPAEAALEIFDDGRGFDPAALGQAAAVAGEGGRGGTGLQGIRERCLFLKGTLKIEASPGAGTRLAIRLPSGRRDA